MSFLTVYMHVCAWCLWKTEEGTEPTGTGLIDGYKLPCESLTQVPYKSDKVLDLWVISLVPLQDISICLYLCREMGTAINHE